MKVRFANWKELPAGWQPGDPVPGNNVDLRTAHECPFGTECYSCRIGLQWHPGFETHLKPPANE
jgi:hypothetical protein